MKKDMCEVYYKSLRKPHAMNKRSILHERLYKVSETEES